MNAEQHGDDDRAFRQTAGSQLKANSKLYVQYFSGICYLVATRAAANE